MSAWGPRIRAAVAAAAVAAFSACADPDIPGRGVLEGRNVVLALSLVFVVAAVGIVVVLLAVDRLLRSRRELAALGPTPEPEPEPEETEEVIAGIRVGKAGVPRWLYAAYVILPLFALFYVLNAAEFAPPADEAPDTPTPTGPATSFVIVAENIQFDLEEVVLAADTEITITLENRDSAPHDWTLSVGGHPAFADELYRTALLTAETGTFTFTSPGPGTYHFHCSVHPSMQGVVVSSDEPAEPEAEGEEDLVVTAASIQFDTDTIRLPAETDVEIEFVNEDASQHNIAIYDSEQRAETIFQGRLIGRGRVTYEFRSPPPGEYFFHCDVHPGMKGTVLVE